MIYHPLLKKFEFREPAREGDFHINCLGAKARSYFPDDWYDVTDRLHPHEETIEWLDMLDSVQAARKLMVFVDLGAGYGRWLVNAALAARQLGKAIFLIGVEAEECHFRWMIEHLADNQIKPHEFRALQGVLSDDVREVYFTEGQSRDWYGQSVVPCQLHGFGDWPDAKTVEKKTIAAIDVFAGISRVDGMHIDIQGEEERVVPHLLPFMQQSVVHVHISTHSEAVHEQIGHLFEQEGWQLRREMPFQGRKIITEIGVINNNDGLQSWRNPRFLENPRSDDAIDD